MMGKSERERGDRQRRRISAARGKDGASGNKKVTEAVNSPVSINNPALGIVVHARGAHVVPYPLRLRGPAFADGQWLDAGNAVTFQRRTDQVAHFDHGAPLELGHS